MSAFDQQADPSPRTTDRVESADSGHFAGLVRIEPVHQAAVVRPASLVHLRTVNGTAGSDPCRIGAMASRRLPPKLRAAQATVEGSQHR
jgi:hypothetical protein